ncbi:hypothetical protein NL676_033049 [Syzygium grande]|nr:hypothetical protein NL676_033049 [Syzygium grande]
MLHRLQQPRRLTTSCRARIPFFPPRADPGDRALSSPLSAIPRPSKPAGIRGNPRANSELRFAGASSASNGEPAGIFKARRKFTAQG